MTVWRNIPLRRAERYAEQFVQLIDTACVKVVIAGEVRRKQAVTSSPLEIVAIPMLIQDHNLFDEPLPITNVLANVITRLIDTGRVDERIERVRGRKPPPNVNPKKLLFRADSGMLCPIDVWATDSRKFGAVLALRTGPYGLRIGLMTAERSVTSSGRAGLLPRNMQLSEQLGLIYRDDQQLFETATEEEFFTAIRVRMVAPEERR